MSLRTYRRKRHFEKTTEPRGATATAPKRQAGDASFVVQKHAASHLHYDFRLEVDGVLKSWAVPKGPSLDPDDKRLAVEVEDHPLEYGDFEGTIPQGEYGGGTVMVWDRGTWTPKAGKSQASALKTGKIEFELHGKKLKGGWVLVRMHGKRQGDKPQWLLRKVEDDEARPSSTYDITEKQSQSAKTGRSLDEIAAGKGSSAVWSSQGAKNTQKPSTRSETVAKTKPKSTGTRKRRLPSAESTDIAGAVAAPMPRELEPELATLVDQAPEGPEWIHEVKFDGYRMLAFVDKGKARLISRNGKDWTDKFAPIARQVESLGLISAILDGEIVAVDAAGRTSFQSLQQSLKGPGEGASIAYFLFDVPYLEGNDLRQATLADRRAALHAMLQRAGDAGSGGVLRFSDAIHGHGREVLHNACKLALEGIVSKRAESPYTSGRGTDWVKSKCTNRQEMVIGGFTEPQRSRPGLGALLIGYYRRGELIYAGKVGTGFDHALLRTLRKRFDRIEQRVSPFVEPPRGADARGAHWVRPEIVCEVEFFEWTKDGLLRHPAFIEIREDKDPKEVVRETRKPMKVVDQAPKKKARAARPARTYSMSDPSKDEVLGVPITHPARVVFPDVGITKLQLAEYYAAVSRWMMPHVKGRPLSVVRCPDGEGTQCFYQKNWERGEAVGSHVRSIRLSNSSIDCLIPDEPSSLVWLVQRGVMEIHTWGCQEPELEHPDRMVFDLDPSPELPWSAVMKAVQRVRDALKSRGINSRLKTTGGKGLHVVVPLKPVESWDRVKAYSKSVADALVAAHPTEYIATMSKAKRVGRVFIDYLRNNRGATFVAPYSTRSRPGAPVSMPVSWKSLSSLRSGSQFTVANCIEHLKAHGDAWKDRTGDQMLPKED